MEEKKVVLITGGAMGQGRAHAYKYAEKLLGHPIFTHEFPEYTDKLKELSKPDFIEICKKLSD